MNRFLLCMLLLFTALLTTEAQTITLSTQSLIFDTVYVNTPDTLSFWVRNSGASAFSVTDINTSRPEFKAKDTSFTIPASDSFRVYVYFKTNQNVTWKDVLLVEGTGLRGALPVRLTGTSRYTGTSYNSTQGLWENALKTALTGLVTGHTQLGYNTARDRMFETVDDQNLNDTIECAYIGLKIYATTRTSAQNQGFNTEHTWPQSFFADEPMVSDLNHLYATDADPNSFRGNLPFGPVVSNIDYNVGGSKRGHRANGATVFEPRDIHKGDVARAIFYFTIRYGNLGSYLDAIQETDLRVWYKSDTVGTKEATRNNRVASYQNKRNPLIDHPEFIDRISYFYTTTAPTLYPEIGTSPTAINFGTIAPGDSVEWALTILNSGRATLNLTSITLQTAGSPFKIINTPTSVPVDSFVQVKLRFVPTLANQPFSNTLVIQNNDQNEGTVNIALNGTSTSSDPAQTTLNTPANSATGVQTPALLTWYRTQTADIYHLQVSSSNTFSSFIVNDSTLVDSSSSTAGLTLNTMYYWRVRSHIPAGWGLFTTARNFTTWTTPAQVVATSPSDGSTGIAIPVLFTWQSAATATGYQFDLSTSPSFATILLTDSSLTGTSKSVSGLALNTQHYWRVRAKNGAGWGTYSTTRSMTTWTTPAQVQSISPLDSALDVPVPSLFRWLKISNATSYQFELSASDTFGSLLVVDSSLTDTTKSLSGLLLNTTYYWRVLARNGAGSGIYSNARSFTTWTTPDQALALNPADGSTDVSVPTLFLWLEMPTADKYQIDISLSNSFGSFVFSDSTVTDTSSSVGTLDANTTYYWRIRAHNGAGWGTYSTTQSFATWNTPAQVQLLSPPDSVKGISLTVECLWQPVAQATTYGFELSASPTFATLVLADSALTDTSKTAPGLDTLTTYYWRVRAKNNVGWGEYSDARQFRIAAALTLTLQTTTGWNIISVPVTPIDSSKSSVFSSAVSAAFAYNNGYVQRDTLQTGPGYWVNFGPTQQVSVSGEPLVTDTVDVNAGWNLVGSISSPVATTSVTSLPAGIIMSSFYGFDNGYVTVSTLMPMKGYWVRCSQQGKLILH